jgi:hypothetical protein
MNYRRGVTSDEKIINIEHKNHNLILMMLNVDYRIRMTVGESFGEQERVHLPIPSSRGLFETIQRTLKSTNQGGILHKSQRLLHIDLLREITMQECTLHIHLKKGPTLRSCER